MSRNKKALIVVDMQMDFCRGGAIAVEGGDSLVPLIKRYMEGFKETGASIYAVRDLHTEDAVHLRESGGKWPTHCVEGTTGAEFHPNLKLSPDTIIITRGLDPAGDCASAFDGFDEVGRTLQESLIARGVTHLYIAGLATDYCVKATVIDGKRLGFAVTILIDAVKALDEKIGDSETAIGEMRATGADTRDLSNMVLTLSRSRQIRR